MFYQGKRVVVTGGAGMIGSCLVKKLLHLGADVIVLDNFSRGYTQWPGATYMYGDAGREGDCRDAFRNTDIVFNLAATVAGVQFNQGHNSYMFESNLRIQTMPLKIASEYGVQKFLQTSSVCVYAPEYNHPAQEDNGLLGQPVRANEGYSWAKRMGEYAARWYAQECGLHVVIVRPSNVIGIRDYFDEKAHVVPALIRKALEQESIEVNGTGNESREFIFAEDVADGMLAAAKSGEKGRAYNLGTNGRTCVKIREIVDMIQGALGTHKQAIYRQMFDAGDDARWSDCTRAEQELGWRAKWELYDAIAAICKWYVEEQDETSI